MGLQAKRWFRLVLGVVLLFMGAGCGGPRIAFRAPVGPQIPIHKDHSIGVVPFEAQGEVNLSGGRSSDGDFDAPEMARLHRSELMTTIIDSGIHGVKDAGAADVVISGRLDFSVNEDRDCREEQVEEHKNVRVCHYDRRARLVVQVNARDKNGKIIETAGWTETEKDEGIRRRELTPWRQMLSELARRAAYEAARRLAPHCILVRAQLQEGDSEVIEAANDQAKGGDWKSAAKVWATATDGSKANRRAAHFNLGVYHERKDRLKKALTHYGACRGTRVCDAAHDRVKLRIETKPRFKQIGLADFSCRR